MKEIEIIFELQHFEIILTAAYSKGSGPLISLNSSMSMTVIVAPFRGPLDKRFNSKTPWKSMDYQI